MSDDRSQINFRVSAAEMAALDNLRRAEADIPSRSEMMRRLLLKASGLDKAAEEKLDRAKGGAAVVKLVKDGQ